MKCFIATFLCLMLASCSSLVSSPESSSVLRNRGPAEVQTSSCADLAKNIFMSDTYEQDLTKVLAERKLITFNEKLIQIQYPRLEWINKVTKSFTTSLRNWNNNRYPSFYIFNDEEVIPTAKRYAENIEKILTNQVAADDTETTNAYLAVSGWMKSYENYKTELDQLIEERISLQYNLSLLKKLKLGSDESRDIEITVKRNGELKNEIITLRSEDKNLDLTIKQLEKEMIALDGTLFLNGKIKERILRQAMLQDILNIVQREMEHSVKNLATPSDQAFKELDKLSSLIKNSDFAPSTYGIYKISNKAFIRELVATSKLDIVYHTIADPIVKIKNIVSNFFADKTAGTEPEKIGIFKRIYSSITNITTAQAAKGGAVVVVGGIGLDRYFAIKNISSTEITDKTPTNEMGPEAEAHQQQLEKTKEVEKQKHDSHSHVIEVQVNSLIQKN